MTELDSTAMTTESESASPDNGFEANGTAEETAPRGECEPPAEPEFEPPTEPEIDPSAEPEIEMPAAPETEFEASAAPAEPGADVLIEPSPEPEPERAAGQRTIGRFVADALRAAGVRYAFTVPGESFLGLLDAFEAAGIRVVATRHEGAASFMAEAHG